MVGGGLGVHLLRRVIEDVVRILGLAAGILKIAERARIEIGRAVSLSKRCLRRREGERLLLLLMLLLLLPSR